MKDLNGKVAVVTGAASGIGRAVATRLAAAGMQVALADIDEPALADTTAELTAGGHTVHGIPTDVSEPDSVDDLADTVWSTFGDVHLLHNNAGVGLAGQAWDATQQDWGWILGVNLLGVVHGIRSFVPRMVEHSITGHIVNTASMAALAAPPELSVYAASKHAVIGLSESLRYDLTAAGAPIGVTVVCPGVVITDIAQAERHRPERFHNAPDRAEQPPLAPPPPPIDANDPSLGVITPISPDAVADMTLDAITNDRFLVLTHQPAAEHLIRTHLDDLLS